MKALGSPARETRYYSGVLLNHTTTYGAFVGALRWRCLLVGLVVAALVGVAPASAGADKKVPRRTVPFFPLTALWTRDMEDALVDGAALSGTRIFVALRSGELRALDLATGTILWTVPRVVAGPLAATDGQVFVQLEDAIVSHDVVTGRERWLVPLPGPLAAPLTVISGVLLASTDAGEVIGLRAADGQQIWRRALGSPMRGRAAGDGDHRLFIVLRDGRTVALDLNTGAPLWTMELGGELSDPLAYQGRVYVGSTTNFFYALDAANGRVHWKWRAGGDVAGPSAADADRVYFVSLDNVLRAVSRGGGNQQWRKDVPTRPAVGPMLAGDTVIIAGVAPELDGFNVVDGAAAGQYLADGEFAGPPLLRFPTAPGEPAVIVPSREGKVTALEAERMLPIEDPTIQPPAYDMPPFGMPHDPPLEPLLTLPGRSIPVGVD